jgi:hypothetical protein
VSSATTAIVSLSGALAVALIAAATAQLRQRTSLEADRDRLELQLEAQRAQLELQLAEERNRLERQLVHDREVRDRDELRRCLDEAVQAMRDAVVCTKRIVDALEAGPGAHLAHRGFAELARNGWDADAAVLIMADRIRLRLGAEHTAAKEYVRGRQACLDVFGISDRGDPAALVRATESRGAALASLFAYIAAAKELVGADVDATPPRAHHSA